MSSSQGGQNQISKDAVGRVARTLSDYLEAAEINGYLLPKGPKSSFFSK